MDVVEAIKTRKCVRNYLDKAIEEEKLLHILEAARLAPSAFNRQRWRFVIVRDRQTKGKLGKAAKIPPFVKKAPIIIVACAKTDSCMMRYGQPCFPIDVAIALDHITLAAVEYGLGTCWINTFDENKVQEILGIPEEIRVIALMPLGYPSDPSIVEKERLPLDVILRYDNW
jgi:nitroreductase